MGGRRIYMVSELSFTESVCDTTPTEISSCGRFGKNFVCGLCQDQPGFKSSKALMTHQRIVHKMRTQMRYFADGDGVCKICGICFRSRLRLLAHLTDSRRPGCSSAIISQQLQPLSESRVAELDAIDRVARTEARRAGHSHAIAVGPARRPTGECIGHVTR